MKYRFFTLVLIFVMTSSTWGAKPAYQNRNLPVDQRVEDLLSRMSLDEKVTQLDMVSGRPLANVDHLDPQLALTLIGEHGVGSIHDFYPVTPTLANELQAFIIAHNRHGIPALYIEETLHGYKQGGSTVFPVPLALASTWNPELVEEVGRAIASEARSLGATVGLSPVLGIAREPRWGRVEETFGEDTYLVSVMGRAMIKGFQGDDLKQPDAIAATVKHFAVHSVPVAGTNSSPASVGKREALQFFLEPFRVAIQDGGARGVMTAYSEWNGVPCTGDRWLLTDLLRDQWEFDGYTIADMGAIRMLSTCHFSTESPSASLQRAISAGVDMQFYDFPSHVFRSDTKELVESGELDEPALDRAVRDILRLKFELGLFDNPYVDPTLAEKTIHSPEHQELALQAAREAVILLKNKGVLPLGEDIKRIAVVGPAGESTYTGGYSPLGASGVTLVEGLRQVVGDEAEVRYAQGVSFIDAGVPVPGNVLWTLDQSQHGLHVSYYPTFDLSGDPLVTQIDPDINFSWDTHSPVHGLPPDSFSVRWEGWLIPTEDIEGWIGVSSDDGSRLWLDDELVIDAWATGVTIRHHYLSLEAGRKYKIRMDYHEAQWGASAALRWRTEPEDIASAVELAEWADVVIVVVGEDGMLVGENRDRLALELSGNLSDLLARVEQAGTPVVLVVISGRPLALGDDAKRADAILYTFFGGEYGGTALAEVLTGNANPGGKLPVSLPLNSGQIPCYYNQKPSRIMRYTDGSAYSQYPFGYGLSFTDFDYSDLELAADAWAVDDTVRFTVTVTNTGDCSGSTVIQAYINDLYSTVTTPLKELKVFQRVTLEAGESRVVPFEIPVSHLALFNADCERVVEPGVFELMIGESSADIRLEGKFEVR